MISLLLTLAAATEPETDAHVYVLDNGLTVVLEPQRRTDTVALAIRYDVGSRDERDGEHGCAHLFEHLMFEGSANVPGNAFDRWLTDAGGWNNAWTSEDDTLYHMSFPSGALDLALFLESDRLGFLDAGLDEANLANQRDVVLQERREGYAEPHGRDWDALSRLQWPAGHPYHVPVIGTEADVSGFGLGAVQLFWQRHYRPRNALLVLVGNFDETYALDRVRHWFSDVPDSGERGPRPPADGAFTPRDGLLHDAVEDRTVYVSWATVPAAHDDAPALELLSWVLDGGRGTRLADALYYRRPITTDMGVYAFHSDLGGQLVFTATAPATPLPRLVKALDAELARLARKPPTEDELARARERVRAGLLDRLEVQLDRAEALAECYDLHGDPNCLAAEWARYEAVTPAAVQRAITTWLVPERRVTLSVVPEGDGGALPGAAPVELP